MKKTDLRLKITSIDYTPSAEEDNSADPAPEVTEYITEAQFVSGENCEIIYRENEELGMGDTTVKICWTKEDPTVVTAMRSGEVETVMTFEEGRRHISAYSMPGMAFELCTHAVRVDNSFDAENGGEIYLDYVIEIRGTFGGRRKMIIEALTSVSSQKIPK